MSKRFIQEITRIRQMMNVVKEEENKVTFEDYKKALDTLSNYVIFIGSQEDLGDYNDLETRLNNIRKIRNRIKNGDEETLTRIWKMAGDNEEHRHAVNVIWFYTQNNPKNHN